MTSSTPALEMYNIPRPPQHLLMSFKQLATVVATNTPYTVALIKPPASVLHCNAIYKRLEEEGFLIGECTKFIFTPKSARQFYCEHEGKPFFETLVKHMCSGPTVFLTLYSVDAKEDPVTKWRKLIGPTSVEQARIEAPNSLRALYGDGGPANAVHGSATYDDAHRENDCLNQNLCLG